MNGAPGKLFGPAYSHCYLIAKAPERFGLPRILYLLLCEKCMCEQGCIGGGQRTWDLYLGIQRLNSGHYVFRTSTFTCWTILDFIQNSYIRKQNRCLDPKLFSNVCWLWKDFTDGPFWCSHWLLPLRGEKMGDPGKEGNLGKPDAGCEKGKDWGWRGGADEHLFCPAVVAQLCCVHCQPITRAPWPL